MTAPRYGTAEYYAELFGDILADADFENTENGDNILTGFYTALDEWLTYHVGQQKEYERLRERVRKALSM